jgi:hypothetical protein
MLTILSTHYNPVRLTEGRPAEQNPLAESDGKCAFLPCKWVRDACAVILYIFVMMGVLVSLALAGGP